MAAGHDAGALGGRRNSAVGPKPLLVDDWLGDYTTRHIGNYNNPIGESLLTNQYHGITKGFRSLLNWMYG